MTQAIADADVNTLLERLLADVQAVLGEQFVGLYVHGSLAGGDFTPGRSDIDFLVVTAEELSDPELSALRAMHGRLRASGLTWATMLEGSYLPRAVVRRYDPSQTSYPALHVDGHFDRDGHGIDWVIQRHIIRERGIRLAGPAPQMLIDPVTPDELRRATQGTLATWWAPQLADPHRLRPAAYQAYAILTMCRALYTLQFGAVVPKSVAARWAAETLGQRWTRLIDDALAWRAGNPFDRLADTLDFIRFTLERIRTTGDSGPRESSPHVR